MALLHLLDCFSTNYALRTVSMCRNDCIVTLPSLKSCADNSPEDAAKSIKASRFGSQHFAHALCRKAKGKERKVIYRNTNELVVLTLLYHQPKNQQQGSDTKSDADSVTLHQ